MKEKALYRTAWRTRFGRRRGPVLRHYGMNDLIEEKMERMRRAGRRHKLLLDNRKEKTVYWSLKKKALDRTVWRTRFWKRLWTCRKTDYAVNQQSLRKRAGHGSGSSAVTRNGGHFVDGKTRVVE